MKQKIKDQLKRLSIKKPNVKKLQENILTEHDDFSLFSID